MAITAITRDFNNEPNIVRIISSDTLSVISATNYILNQKLVIEALNNGLWTWLPSDFVLVWSSAAVGGGWGFFNISSNFNSLIPFAFSSSVIGTPVVVGDFAIFQSTSGNLEDLGYSPSNASKTKVVMANGASIVNHIATYTDTVGTIGEDAATAINGGNLQAGLSGTAGTVASFPSAATSGSLILAAVTNSSGNFNTTISNASAVLQSQVISIPDSGAATANFLLSSALTGQSVSTSTASATPGTIRALIGSMTSSNSVMTSGTLTGVRGVLTGVGASGGFWYGTQGKIIATGTLSGSLWAAGVFGQLDVSAATINAGQVAAIWGDWGATGAVSTDMTGTSGIKFTNTTANKLNEQINTYGDATYYLNIRGNPGPLSYYIAAGTSAGSAGDSTHCAAQQVLKIIIQGVAAYIPIFTQNT